MTTSITFFPVGNGDMTLVSLGDEKKSKILIDCNIRQAADDDNDETPDVAQELRSRINNDEDNRPYVDVFLLSHPDQDHCSGLERHFYLGSLDDYPDDDKEQDEKRIIIRELWSSPIIFRRASKSHKLCPDAKAFNSEAKRRVAINEANGFKDIKFGDQILIMGEDENNKTDNLEPILIKVDETFSTVGGIENDCFTAQLLAPFTFSDDADEEETLSKNHSSVILNVTLANDSEAEVTKNFLTCGDAEVSIWEKLWEKHKGDASTLEYDLLQSPHHCSWHSLSHDSWSELGKKANVSNNALKALSQIREGGVIIASSNAIKDDDNDPPCFGAKEQYSDIAEKAGGEFYCTGEYPNENALKPIEYLISDMTVGLVEKKSTQKTTNSLLRSTTPIPVALSFPDKPVKPNKPAGFA